MVFTDNSKEPIRVVNFNVQATGTYRLRLRNLGPGVVPLCTSTVFEF